MEMISKCRETDRLNLLFADTYEEDAAEFKRNGLDVDLSGRVRIVGAYREKEVRHAETYMKAEDFERLGVEYIVEHAQLVADLISPSGWCLEIPQDDWYNDTVRNPECQIRVDFIGIQQNTGREIYKDPNGRYYTRTNFFPKEKCAKWHCCGQEVTDDGWRPRPNTIFVCNGRQEKVTYKDWNGTMAYSDTFNKEFNTAQ